MAKQNDHKSNDDQSTSKKEIHQTNPTSHYFITFLIFIIALLLGILIQQNFSLLNKQPNEKLDDEDNYISSISKYQSNTQAPASSFDQENMEKMFKEMGQKLKNEIIETVQAEMKSKPTEPQKNEVPKKVATKSQDDIINEQSKVKIELPKYKNEPTRVTVGEEVVKDKDDPEMKLKAGEPIVINPSANLNLEKEKPATSSNKIKNKEKEPLKENDKEVEKRKGKTKQSPTEHDTDEAVKNFQTTQISKIKPKKMWIPIPNR